MSRTVAGCTGTRPGTPLASELTCIFELNKVHTDNYNPCSMTKSRKWAAGVYDPSVGFMVAGGWGDQTAETSSDGASFTRIGTLLR